MLWKAEGGHQACGQLCDHRYHDTHQRLGKERYEEKVPPIQEGDILIHGHTHVLKAEQKEGYVLLNPGSVSIPKEGNPPTYAIFEDGVFTIKDFEGNIVKSIEL